MQDFRGPRFHRVILHRGRFQSQARNAGIGLDSSAAKNPCLPTTHETFTMAQGLSFKARPMEASALFGRAVRQQFIMQRVTTQSLNYNFAGSTAWPVVDSRESSCTINSDGTATIGHYSRLRPASAVAPSPKTAAGRNFMHDPGVTALFLLASRNDHICYWRPSRLFLHHAYSFARTSRLR
jgi:hypothetical protein